LYQRAESSGPVDDVDADDVFAQLHRMAAASGQVEREGQDDEAEDGEAIHLPISPDGVSAFDRLMETPAPSAGVGGPRLDRRLQVDKQAEEPAPTFAATTEDVVEQDAPVEVEAVQEQIPVSAAPAEVVAEQPAAPAEPEVEVSIEEEVSVEEQVSTDEADEKVVSFPGRMVRTRGAASGLFDSGIHEEFMSVGLSGLAREASGLPVESVAVVLDEVLRTPGQGSSEAPVLDLTPHGAIATNWPVSPDVATILPAAAAALPRPTSVLPDRAVWTPAQARLAPVALTFISPHRVFSPVEGGDDLLAAISQRDVGALAEFVVERSCEPYFGLTEPYLPVGLAQSMGVVPPNRGQLIRSELFIKEPEVRECAMERSDTTRETDVRRAYYGRQGTA
jgi:hypothetical protein